MFVVKLCLLVFGNGTVGNISTLYFLRAVVYRGALIITKQSVLFHETLIEIAVGYIFVAGFIKVCR
jgi:hypothetical protein